MYIAHKYNDRLQSVDEHCKNVAKVSSCINKIEYLDNIIKLIGEVHDVGKYSEKFQKYILEGDVSKRGSVKHSIGSGLIFDDLDINNIYYSIAKELINNVVMCHHGIDDFVSPNDFRVRQEDRITEFRKNYDCNSIRKCFFDKQMSKSEFEEKTINICKDIEKMFTIIREDFHDMQGMTECKFYVNMIARYLMSLLIDADSMDAENFEKEKDFVPDANMQELWNKFSENLINKLNTFENKTLIDDLRSEISNKCFEVSKDEKSNIYRLAVPTGMGKTLSSLRFAIEKCRRKNKDHIFYIAPFNSILEQNSKELQKVVGKDNVLEHHCNVIHDRNEKTGDETYECKIKNWDSPVIATSAVQFLNCLFGGRREDIRRFHTLSNSVIIIDEIQFLPIKCTYIFNLAINFLSKICGTDIVLCSATQPPLDELTYKIDAKNIIDNIEQLPIRVTPHLIDNTFKNEDEFTDFIKDKIDLNCLIIVNTKKCALKIYKKLSREFSDYKVYYLSTNMCAEHRNDILEKHIKKALKNNEKVICVSTQLIEAGVDISFQTVVRSMCGMDSIIQSCGRCNRNDEYAPNKGQLYIVRFWDEFENLGSLEDIKCGKGKSQNVFHYFKKKIKENSEYIFSKEVMDEYYNEYFSSRRGEMTYPINNSKFKSSILELLSVNTNDCHNEFVRQNKIEPFMTQAPKTAGREFEVIEGGEKEDFIVYYKDSGKLIAELYADKNTSEKMDIIKKLQRYTVSLYENEYKRLDYEPRYLTENYSVNILSERNYNEIFGVSSEENNSETMII